MKSSPTFDTIGQLISSLSSREQPEISSLVLRKLYTSMQQNSEIRLASYTDKFWYLIIFGTVYCASYNVN